MQAHAQRPSPPSDSPCLQYICQLRQTASTPTMHPTFEHTPSVAVNFDLFFSHVTDQHSPDNSSLHVNRNMHTVTQKVYCNDIRKSRRDALPLPRATSGVVQSCVTEACQCRISSSHRALMGLFLKGWLACAGFSGSTPSGMLVWTGLGWSWWAPC